MKRFRLERGPALMLGLAIFSPMDARPGRKISSRERRSPGKVTLDGQPLPKGMIQFRPAGQAEATASGAIDEGRFAIPRARARSPASTGCRSTPARTPPPPRRR